MQSRKLSVVDGQRALPLVRAADPQPVADAVIFAQRSFAGAIALAVNVSGLEEKEIYLALEIDAGHWTRIMKGDAHFPVNKLNEFCDIVRNEIPLIWWAHSRGKGLHMLETESERQLKLANERAAKAEEKLAYLESLHTKAVR